MGSVYGTWMRFCFSETQDFPLGLRFALQLVLTAAKSCSKALQNTGSSTGMSLHAYPTALGKPKEA